MPLCGFNGKMIEGLRLLGQGLYEQAEKRAEEDGVALKASFDNELEEMDIFKQILKSKDQNKFQALKGVTELAQALYRNGRGLEEPKEKFHEELELTLRFLIELDDQYYKVFRPNSDPRLALRKLGEWMG